MNMPLATGNTGSAIGKDPNAIVGPAGFEPQKFIPDAGTWAYMIDFENQPTANAAAQVVTVTQQLDPDLDWSTFEIGSFGFGPVTVIVPPGLTHYDTQIDYRNAVGSPLRVDVTIDFDASGVR